MFFMEPIYNLFQFTRPRGGAMLSVRAVSPHHLVSIHTPPWGRDFAGTRLLVALAVSIHTPPWGRDTSASTVAQNRLFQFTRPRGGAIYRLVDANDIKLVSIHTPPWGRDKEDIYSLRDKMFQFTRPRGGAIASPSARSLPCGFNSHAPVGARFRRGRCGRARAVSIHTPPWGRDWTSRPPSV